MGDIDLASGQHAADSSIAMTISIRGSILQSTKPSWRT